MTGPVGRPVHEDEPAALEDAIDDRFREITVGLPDARPDPDGADVVPRRASCGHPFPGSPPWRAAGTERRPGVETWYAQPAEDVAVWQAAPSPAAASPSRRPRDGLARHID